MDIPDHGAHDDSHSSIRALLSQILVITLELISWHLDHLAGLA
jgi:hypothetical protein